MDNSESLLTTLPAFDLEGTLIYPQTTNTMIYYKAHIWLCNQPLPILSMHFFSNTLLLEKWAQSFLHGLTFLFHRTSCFYSLILFILVQMNYFYGLYSPLLCLGICHPLFSVGSTSSSRKPFLTVLYPHPDWVVIFFHSSESLSISSTIERYTLNCNHFLIYLPLQLDIVMWWIVLYPIHMMKS